MAKPKDVTAALDALDHPLRDQIDYVRALTRSVGGPGTGEEATVGGSGTEGGSGDITEQWKWSAPTFSVGSDYLFTFHLRPTEYLHLVVHHPDAPTVDSPMLEGDYPDGRRMIYLRGRGELVSGEPELRRVLLELIHRTRERAASTHP